MEKNKERTENTEGMIRFSISVPPEMNSELDKFGPMSRFSTS